MNCELAIGYTFSVKFPFYKTTTSLSDGDGGGFVIETWAPGVLSNILGPGDIEYIAHGEGLMFLTVVGVYKPGKFPVRIFFTRQWQDPSGKCFGRQKCHIVTLQKFKRLIRGYAIHYTLCDSEEK